MAEHSWLIRNTAARKGRSVFVTPATNDFKYLSAARILLDAAHPSITAHNAGAETTLLVLHGTGRVRVGGHIFNVSRFDGVYVPRDEEFIVETDTALDILEGSAPTDMIFPAAHARHEETRTQEGMHLNVGGESTSREIFKAVAENVPGAKLLTGVTMSKPGNWTSWPPHEHAATQEELYVFFDMPRPGFGTQFVYTDMNNPELIAPVYENDAVVLVKGYHPNVAAPGYPINFAWILCSLEDLTWRKVGGVNVQPEFQRTETGLR
ncbi:MAG: 5-deoxy-glucuronate isomerase [Bacteroidetes bacterium]|nr:5-deoxy-glucuronate isomerase [Bacteroidota bacterium]